jgi:alkaline phosphatase D
MDRRQFLKWGSFVTVSVATSGLAACGGDDDTPAPAPGANPAPPAADQFSFLHGVASGDPKADSIVLWTRVDGDNGGQPVTVTLQVSAQPDFATLLVNDSLTALPEWDYTLRNKVTGLAAATTYYYRFTVGGKSSPVGRTRTAPAPGTPLSQLRFAFVSCQDWSVNHWAGMEELAAQDLDFIVHLGDYIYETVGADFQSGKVEGRHAQLRLPDGTARADGASYATSIEDYRYLYKSYRSDPRLQALHARFPIIAIWDDHEFSDDCWQDRQTYDTDEDVSPRTARRRGASQAWFEFMPADVSLDLANPSFQNIQLYRAFTFGDLATLVMTDQRLYRADHVLPEQAAGSEIGSRYFVPKATLATVEDQKMVAAGNTLAPVSILGDAQRAWWQDRMGSANTTWKLWGNEVSLLRMQIDGTQAIATLIATALVQANGALAPLQSAMTAALVSDLNAAKAGGTYPAMSYTALKAALVPAGINGATFDALFKPALDAQLPPAALLGQYILNADQWDGYNAERKNLMAFLKTHGIGNVVALTGDIHAFFAGPVMDDYDAAMPVPVMVDLVTAGLSSNSFQSYFRSVVDSDPTFAAAKPLIYANQGGVVVNTFDTTLKAFNPWLRHVDTDAQGYAVVTLTQDKLSCTFNKLKPLVDGAAPALPVTASSRTVEVMAGSAAVNVL